MTDQHMPFPASSRDSNPWLVHAALSAISCVLLGGPLVSLSVYIAHLSRAEGWSESALGAIASVLLLTLSLSSLVSGALSQKITPRRVILLGGLLTSAGCISAAKSSDSMMFLLSYAIIGTGTGLASLIPAISILSDVFPKRRGAALGLYFALLSLAAALIPVANEGFIQQRGWRRGYEIMAAVIAAFSCLALALRIRSKASEAGTGPRDENSRIGIATVLRSPGFWLLTGAMSLSLLNTQAILFGVVDYLRKMGLSANNAVFVFSAANLCSVPAMMLAGLAADRWNARTVLSWTAITQAVGTLALLGAGLAGAPGWLALCLFVTFWGMTCSAANQLGPIILGDLSDSAFFPALLGVNTAVIGLAGALGPAMMGVMLGLGANYRMVFILYAALCLLAVPLIRTAGFARWKRP